MITYYLMKIIQSFIFPPGIIILFLFFATIFTKRFKKFFLSLTIISYLLSMPFIANLLIKPLEDIAYKISQNNAKADLVVILGGGYYEGSPNLPLSQSSFKRAIYGLMLSKEHNIPILYNGTILESKNAKFTYQELNKSLKLDLKFAKNKIYQKSFIIYFENRALNTKDNAKLAKEFLEKNHIQNAKIFLVTSAYHMLRATQIFKSLNLQVIPKATDFQTSSEICYCNFFPSADGLRISYNALHEYVALLKNRVKGWF